MDIEQQAVKILDNVDNAKAQTIRQTNATSPSLHNSNAATVMGITKLGIKTAEADLQKDRRYVC
jgi:hypothetical protein